MELSFNIILLFLTVLFLFSQAQEFPLGEISQWGEHDVSSGEATLMSNKKLKIKKFNYDGTGPAAYFMVGKEKDSYTEELIDLDGKIIPDETGSCDRLGEYDDQDIILTLPKGMKFSDYSYVSVYCHENNHNFGYFRIKDEYVFTTPAPVYLLNTTSGEVSVQKDISEDDAPAECDQDDILRRRRRGLSNK